MGMVKWILEWAANEWHEDEEEVEREENCAEEIGKVEVEEESEEEREAIVGEGQKKDWRVDKEGEYEEEEAVAKENLVLSKITCLET